jgi:hypothetical protein
MADDRTPAEPFDVPITLSDPPAEPFDVPVSLSPPPAEPFDVEINLSGPPWEPFDVPIVLDPPPWEPIDVGVVEPAPPADPFDVPVFPSAPPAEPFDVPIVPSADPADPVDVPTFPSREPSEPFDVPIVLDPPPWEPVDVSVELPAPPWDPFEPSIELPRPPWEPVDVVVVPSPPPAEPFDVPIVPSLPAVQPIGSGGSNSDFDRLVETVSTFDGQLGNFLSGLIGVDLISPSSPGGGALNPNALIDWFTIYNESVGSGGIARFIAEQTALYSMNPTIARVFDPFYFVKMMVPGSPGNVSTAIDTLGGATMQDIARVEDALLVAQVSAEPERNVDGGTNLYGPSFKYSEGQAVSVDELVSTALDDVGLSSSPFASTVDGITRFDAISFFETRKNDGTSNPSAAALLRVRTGRNNVSTSRLARSSAADGIIPSKLPGESSDGTILSNGQDPSEVVDDDDARVPLSFTDIRQVPGKRYRSVYFKPLNLQFAMAFAPEFSDASTFGRVDPVVGYQRTTRSMNVSFEVHAFSPEDLENIYRKMVWLSSMCYPSYSSDALMTSGPVTRMRIGDVVATADGGVPGVIKSLNFDFADAIWELQKGFKVPRSYKVSIDFLALHDGTVGNVNGAFGLFRLPASRARAGVNTNFVESDGLSEDDGISMIQRGYMRFGESRED